MKRSYIVKLTTRTRNIRYLIGVEKQRPQITADKDQATIFTRKSDINRIFRSMTRDYINQNWEVVEIQ